MTQWPFDPAKEKYVSLATYKRNGNEVLTPLWLAGAGNLYYLFSAGDAGKVKRVRNNGKARIAACTFRGHIRSGWLDAEARVVEAADDIERAYRALHDKYGWQMRMTDVFSKLAGRYHKRAIIEIRITTQQ